MSLFNVVTAPWAIFEPHLDMVQAVYFRHISGEKVDLKAVEASLGRPLGSKAQGYEVVDGVALVPINGILAKKASALEQTSGMNSMDKIGRDFQGAMADPSVKAVILHIDSPGGTVDGTMDLARMVREARGTKPIVSFADGLMASAALWIGTAADQVIISGPTTEVGSIGVVATHVDMSGADAKAGIKRTEITAGKFKRITSSNAPLSDEGQSLIQKQVNTINALFMADVALQRGVSVEQVQTDMADGRMFMGQEALQCGLVDGVSTLSELIARLATDTGSARVEVNPPALGAGAALPLTPLKGASIMDRKTLKAEHPELVNAILAEGASAERERIQAVEEAGLPGHEALIATLKFDGKTSGGDAALAVNRAEKAKRGSVLASIAQEAPAPLPGAAAPAPKVETPKIDPSLPLEERCKAEWAADASIRQDFVTAEDYTAYAVANEAGLVKTLGAKA